MTSADRYRYAPWDDGPDPLAPPVDLRAALERLGQDVMDGSSPRSALDELLRRGTDATAGLDELTRRVWERRSRIQRRNNLDGTLRDVRELLDRALDAERAALFPDPDDDARFREAQLDALPPGTAAAVRDLASYDWRSEQARADFQRIRDLLGQELVESRFQGMKQALSDVRPEDVARIRAMMTDLNALLLAHLRGEDTDERFADFMRGHGEFFPENPRSVTELIDALAARAAAAQRMMNSMSERQRGELQELMAGAFGDPRLAEQVSTLDANLRALRPGEDWTSSARFRGGDPLGLGDGAQAMSDLAELDALAEQLAQSYPGARLEDIDLEALARQLGDDAVVDARALSALERELRAQGLLERAADGTLRLSPKALRRLGETALSDVVGALRARRGSRDTRRAGAAGEPTGGSRPWAFGDTEPWDVPRTLTNAVLRTPTSPARSTPTGTAPSTPTDAGRSTPTSTARSAPATTPADTAPRGGIGPVRIQVSDVEVVETEQRSRAAVALCVDTSWSMVQDNRWIPMKRTALALHHLVQTRFRGDDLQLITFGRHAAPVDIGALTALEGVWEQGTNLHHALLLAGRHLRANPDARPVVLVVTDGEPTAHLEPDGEAAFAYPTTPRTLRKTLGEVDRLARAGASLTVFKLGDDERLARFVDIVARRGGGRVVNPDLDGLGPAVVGDYLRSRRAR